MTVQAVATAKPAGKAAEAAPPQSWTIAGRKKDPEVEKLVELSYLLLEGNRHIRAMIRDALHGMAIRKISEMDSAEEALMHLEKREFDALLVGGELPAMSTIEFVWRLRRSADAKLRQTPVVMIGEDATEHAVRKAVDVGV
ncbi:MAG: response regulator, partial [Alphaproteobacteria bacterium]|nr:response regulator [Alphaproteobacteria bacterium]